MLQIKNTLGGGKPEGLYAWKKSENVFDKIEYSNKASASYPVDNIDGAAVVYNDYLYYIGGSVNLGSVYRFDGNSWSSVKRLPTPTDAKYGPAVVYNGKIHYFYGGGDGVTHYSYDGTDWTQEIDSPMDMGYQSALVYNDKMYVLGRGSMYRYDNTEWTLIGSLPVNTSVTTAIVHDGKIHIVGGMNATSSSKLKSHYVYDGVNWSADIDLPGINSGHYLVSFHGDLYSLGGTNYSYAQKMLKYTGTSWEQVATLPFEFYQGGCAVYKGEIYIIGTNYSTTYYRYVYSIAREIYRLDFIDYVVSDKETAYPDGGEKGGYCYEKVVENDLSNMVKRATETIVFDNLTFASNVSSYEIGYSDVKAIMICQLSSEVSTFAEAQTFGYIRQAEDGGSNIRVYSYYDNSSRKLNHSYSSDDSLMNGSAISFSFKAGWTYKVIIWR